MQIGKEIHVHFLGIGGIGMSALARWCRSQEARVSGYDLVDSALSRQLTNEGIEVMHESLYDEDSKPDWIVYTPAIPEEQLNEVFQTFPEARVFKRSELLGVLSQSYQLIAVAGTHGKTTTSTMLADMMVTLDPSTLVVLGGLHKTWNSNLHLGEGPWMITEADEFDRSFLTLTPEISIVNSVDADHLDIYGDQKSMLEGYVEYIKGHKESSTVLIAEEAHNLIGDDIPEEIEVVVFGEGAEVDIRLANSWVEDESMWVEIEDSSGMHVVQCPMPGRHNAYNLMAAYAVGRKLGYEAAVCLSVLSEFPGIKRRFEMVYRSTDAVVIDDYAHHPTEIFYAIETARKLFPSRNLHVIFQAHLYSRTQDFMDEFAEVLSSADYFYSCEIYPAREEPIPGVTGKTLFDKVKANKKIFDKKELLPSRISWTHNDAVLILGAGNIDSIIGEVIETIEQRK